MLLILELHRESKKVNKDMIFGMIGDGFVVSVFMLGIFTLAGYRFPTYYLIKQFLPVTFGKIGF